MHNRETDMLWWTNNLQSNQGVNYSLAMINKLKTGGNKAWLASLPMYEYAYVLLTSTMLRLGGKPENYITDLYDTRMAPILDFYYKKLARYRMLCLLIKRQDESMREQLSGLSIADETEAMQKWAIKTRKALRGVCEDIEMEMKNPRRRRPPTEETLPDKYAD